jgi:hypothetical protein
MWHRNTIWIVADFYASSTLKELAFLEKVPMDLMLPFSK